MLEVADALSIVLEQARPLKPASRSFSSTLLLDHILAADARADRDSPPFDKSLRDGFAVRSADCTSRAELRIVEEIAAGTLPKNSLGTGECSRIFTGAPMPDGADAVVMQEDTETIDDRVRILDSAVRPGQWIFPRASEMRVGDVVLAAGTRITPAAIGILAAIGLAKVKFYSKPRVAVIATGDELVDVLETPGPGQIRNSNGPMLVALAAAAGGRVTEYAVARDTESDLKKTIGAAMAKSDAVLLAGGVSAGKFDLVPNVLEQLGVTPHFHKVRMKPGKPLLFGTKDRTLVFGLPGNPVSAFVCFELFARPALRKLAGDANPGPRLLKLPLAEAIAEANDRPTYRPAKLEPAEVGWSVRPLPWAGAPDLCGIAAADALIVLPPGESRYDAGMPVSVIELNA
ncbi:MAG TPA: gephyrin-like molybdotransferase Glp [Urbifossiella sp.]